MTPTPIADHLELVVQGEAHRSRCGRHPGGEWDPWRSLTARKRHTLIGARFARPNALWPDELADLINRRHPGLNGTDPLEWYFRTCFEALNELRHARNRDRHTRIAEQTGHATYYRRRQALAVDAGYRSFWQYRQSQWGPRPAELRRAA
jgi:hypothetical protein